MTAPRKRGPWGWLFLLLFLATGIGAAIYKRRAKPPLQVRVAKVERGQVREIIPAASDGIVEPNRRVVVRAEVAGTVAEVKKRRGDRVDPDEPIVLFRVDEIGARLQQAGAQVEASKVALDMAESRKNASDTALTRAKKLHAGGIISPAELDRAEVESDAARHAIEQARAAVKQAQAALRLARLANDRAIVTAPFAGILQDVMVEVGVQIAPTTALFDLIDDSSVHIDVPVDEGDAQKIRTGQRVLLRVDVSRSEQLEGTVRFIPPAIGKSGGSVGLIEGVPTKRDRFLHVEVEPSKPELFRVGASVNGEFLVSAKSDVLYLPTQVVIGRGVEREVYVIDKGKAKKKRFVPGLTSWERTEVVSGLSEGETVIATLNNKELEEGVRVEIAHGADASGESALHSGR